MPNPLASNAILPGAPGGPMSPISPIPLSPFSPFGPWGPTDRDPQILLQLHFIYYFCIC